MESLHPTKCWSVVLRLGTASLTWDERSATSATDVHQAYAAYREMKAKRQAAIFSGVFLIAGFVVDPGGAIMCVDPPG